MGKKKKKKGGGKKKKKKGDGANEGGPSLEAIKKAEGLEKSAASVEKDSEEFSEVPRRARASSRSPLDAPFDAAGSDGRSDTVSEDTAERLVLL